MPSGDTSCHVGVDENGLGARLGALVVAALKRRGLRVFDDCFERERDFVA
jgi:hypothetical protein